MEDQPVVKTEDGLYVGAIIENGGIVIKILGTLEASLRIHEYSAMNVPTTRDCIIVCFCEEEDCMETLKALFITGLSPTSAVVSNWMVNAKKYWDLFKNGEMRDGRLHLTSGEKE